MGERLWDLANLVTGFAVVQNLTMIVAVIKGELRTLRGCWRHALAIGLTLLFMVLYLGAILWCYREGVRLEQSNALIWYGVTVGRGLAVVLLSVMLSGVLVVHLHDESRKVAVPPLRG